MVKGTEFLGKLFGGGNGGVIGKVLDKFVPDKDKKAQIELELKMLIHKESELYFKDLESARNMQSEALRQDDKFSKRFVYYLSSAVFLNMILAGLLAIFIEYPDTNRDMATMYFTVSFTFGAQQVFKFFFGNQKQ